MVCNEEVFDWFSKELSGTKRVELMCGLMSMCIPLEIRFFKSYIEELAKKDMNTLREAELKANSFQEMDTICKCDLLHITAEVPINDTNDLKTNVVTNCEIQSNVIQSNCNINNTVNQSIPSIPQPLHQSSQTPTPVNPIQDMTGVAANGTAILSQNEIITIVPTPPPPQLSHYPSRSRLIISLCFLSPANRSCSVVAFKALRQQLTATQIGTVVSNYLKFGRSVYDLNDFFSGIQLLLTLAVYHPAFSYEERQLISTQRGTVEQTINGYLYNQFRQTQNQNYPTNTLPFPQYGPHQSVHTPPNSQIHGHIGPHSAQPHPQSPGVNAGGQAAHSQSHSHVNIGQMPGPVPTHQTGQYATHSYISQIPTNINFAQNLNPNISGLRVSSVTSPVSTPSPTSSPSSSKTVTSVAGISPLPMTEFMTHNIHSMTENTAQNQNQNPYILTTGITPIPHQTLSEDGGGVCAKTIISCYNCGSIGHRGDDCRTQSQEEANR